MFQKILQVSLLFLFSAAASAEIPIYTGFFSSTAIKGYDTVAYFTENKAVEGSKDFELEWQGATWRFASAANRDMFQQDPERFAPQYGGHCAYALAVKDSLVKIDPEAWSIVDDKLYLNYSQSIRKDWLENKQQYIRQADANWPGHLD